MQLPHLETLNMTHEKVRQSQVTLEALKICVDYVSVTTGDFRLNVADIRPFFRTAITVYENPGTRL
jgi:hypothetical protein